jgi:hypothetical protein
LHLLLALFSLAFTVDSDISSYNATAPDCLHYYMGETIPCKG